MNPDDFANRVLGLQVDEAAFRDGMARLTPADRCYVIVFSPRSGSTWLTSILSATGRLGHPEEYLHPGHIRGVAHAMAARDPTDLLRMLKRRRQTRNGVFGLEVRNIDVKFFGEKVFFEAFGPNTVFYHLWRDNIVAQGISLYRAVATGKFHAKSEEPPPDHPPYDAAEITRWIRHVLLIENDNILLLRHAGRTARQLRYEDIVKDRAGTIESFASDLRVKFAPGEFAGPAPTELRKIGDDWNKEAEARLRREQPDLVAEIELARLIRGDARPPTRPASGPAAARPLDEATLVKSAWRYGHHGKAPEALALRLLPGGAIGGYNHPNERIWRLEDGVLSLLRADGTRTVRFDDVTGEPGALVLRGNYRGDASSDIVLRLEQAPPGPPPRPIVEDVVATLQSPAFDVPPPDLRQRNLIPEKTLRAMEPTWTRGRFAERPVRLVQFRDVFVAKEGLVFTGDLQLVPASVTQHSEADIAWARWAIEQGLAEGTIPHVTGTAVLCKKRGAGNYGHWLMEMFPKAVVARLLLREPDWRVIVAEQRRHLGTVMAACLAHVGLDGERCVVLPDAPARVDRLVLVEGLTQHGSYTSPLAVNAVGLLAGGVSPAPDRKLYVTRDSIGHRRFSDEPAVAARAAAAGYRVFDPGTATLAEQIAAFSGAQVIVGTMGAALTNIVFAPTGAQVVSLAPANMPDTFFWLIAALRGLRYREVRCEVVGPTSGPTEWDRDMRFPEALAADIFP